MTNETKKQPIHKVQFGTIRVTVWENTNQKGEPFPNFNLESSYRDRDGQWQTNRISLTLSEMAKAALALNKAYADFYDLPHFKRGDGTAESVDEAA